LNVLFFDADLRKSLSLKCSVKKRSVKEQLKHSITYVILYFSVGKVTLKSYYWALCPAALLPELQPAPCFLSAIIGQIDSFRCA